MDVMSGDFRDIRPLPAFVDKTMLLDTIMQDKYKSVCLIAPRRFGKSVNLSMLKRFWEVLPDEEAISENRKLFKGHDTLEDTKIATECSALFTQHFGKYPIIFLDFLCSKEKVTCYGSVLALLRNVVHKAYERHSYLQRSVKLNDNQKKNVEEWCCDRTYRSVADTSEEIQVALENLAKYLFMHFGEKVIVLVDEYDCVCSSAILNVRDLEEGKELLLEGPRERRNRKAADEINEIISLCMGSIGCLLKSNDHVFRGVLTGISYLATMGLSTLNVDAYKFQDDHDFTNFYGITLEELEEVLSRKEVSMESESKKMKKNYNGYRGNMLSTWSVMHYLNDGGNREDINYWKQSGIVVGLDEAFSIPAMRSIVTYLLSDLRNKKKIRYLSKIEPVHIVSLKNVVCSPDAKLDDRDLDVFLNFLLEQGYLKRGKIVDRNFEVQIPNYEIRSEFSEKLELFYACKFNLNITKAEECAALFDQFSTSNSEVENKELLKKINVSLNQIINEVTFNHKNEASLHHIIFFILFTYSKKFKCFSEIKGGEGRLDLLLLSIDFRIGIIIELKFGKTAYEGLKQIIVNDYCDSFKNVKYNPDEVEIDCRVFSGLNMSDDQKITMCSVLNHKTEKVPQENECFNC